MSVTGFYTEDEPINQLVDSCSKWDATNPEWKFPRGCASSIFKTFSLKLGSKAIQAKRPGTSKTSQWNAHFPFGDSVWEFWSTFDEIPFSRENFRSGRQNLSFQLHSIRNVRIFWVNGKKPMSLCIDD